MKRLICLLLALLYCLPILGCTSPTQSIQVPVKFYYRSNNLTYNNSEGVITAESRESFGHEEDYAYLVEQYLSGPKSDECISPFPAGTQLVQLDFLKDKVLIELSSHISLLSGSELSVACSCLAKTLLEITGMKEVKISSHEDLLDGQEYISITQNDIVLIDTYSITH